MSYSKEQFIEDFKNAYNQSQQLHFIYRYVENGGKNISSINFETVNHDVKTDVTIVVTLNDGEILRGNTIRVANDGLCGYVDTLQEDVGGLTGSVDDLRTSYNTLAEDVRVDKVNISTLFGNVATNFQEITNIKNGRTHLFETITDRHGNPRFVEGDITMNTIEGVTQTYGKWSLSGSHLMIVVAGNATNKSVFTNTNIFNVNLPDWIVDKLVTISNTYLDVKTFDMYNTTNLTAQSFRTTLVKLSTVPKIRCFNQSNLTLTADRSFRIQFDLLIDDE